MSSAAKPQRGNAEVWIGRLRGNLAQLIEHYGIKEAARYSGYTDEGLRLIARGERTPGSELVVDLCDCLGADPAKLYLPPAEFAKYLRTELGEPFFAPPRVGRSKVASASGSKLSHHKRGRIAAKGPYRNFHRGLLVLRPVTPRRHAPRRIAHLTLTS